MRNVCNPETSFIYRVFLFLLVLFVGLLFTYLFFLAIAFIQSGFELKTFNEIINNLSTNVNSLRLMQVLQSFFVFIIPPFILVKLYGENPNLFLQLRKPGLKASLIGISSIIFMTPLINVLTEWNAALSLPEYLHGLEKWMLSSEAAAEKITTLMMKGTSWLDLGLNLIIVAILAGIGEELLFRGLFQSLIAKFIGPFNSNGKKPDWVIHLTIWIVAILFSAIHLQFFGFFPRLILGAWFGYLLWWTGSIWVPILAHFTNNAMSTIVIFSVNKGLITKNPDMLGLHDTWWLSLISIFLLTGCVYYLKFSRKR